MAWPKGRPHPKTPEHVANHAATLRGRPLTAEHRAKLSEARRGRKQNPVGVAKRADALRGKPLSDAARANMSAAGKRKILTAEHRANIAASSANRGKPLSDEVRAKIRAKALGRPARFAKRVQWDGRWFRSTWEIRVAKALTALGVKWEYEPRSFTLSDGSRYTPDFYLPESDAFWEVKGWWNDTAERKTRLFRQMSIAPLVVCTKQCMEMLEAQASVTR